MQDLWRMFEGRIKDETMVTDTVITHIPSHAEKTKRGYVRKKTDCDFALASMGRAAFLDAKSCNGSKFYFSEHHTFELKKIHQYRFLIEARAKGSKAGYLIWLYDKGLILWVPVSIVAKAEVEGGKFIDETTPGITIQKDDQPINLKKLIWGD